MIKVTFTYNKDKDIWCLLSKGKSSNNAQTPTKVYGELVEMYGDTPTREETSTFIDLYMQRREIDVAGFAEACEKDWKLVEGAYHEKAEAVFGVTLTDDFIAYLTVNTRCPYSIENKHFFVSVFSTSACRTAMHELWHFYTWQKFGSDVEAQLGKQKYNDIKESLTVLLNSECADLLPEGITDDGYPQHAEMREKVASVWKETRDISKVWEACI